MPHPGSRSSVGRGVQKGVGGLGVNFFWVLGAFLNYLFHSVNFEYIQVG